MGIETRISCDGCGREYRADKEGSFVFPFYPPPDWAPPKWGTITTYSPVNPCPNQAKASGYGVRKQWIVCSEECFERVLSQIYRDKKWRKEEDR
jgi:hypothetical protein